MIAAVQAAVPAYRVLDRNVRIGVAQALEGFIEVVDSGRLPGLEVYTQFGRGEARNGRALDVLLQAYRVGAQATWRGVAEAGDRAGVDPHTLYELAERIFDLRVWDEQPAGGHFGAWEQPEGFVRAVRQAIALA